MFFFVGMVIGSLATTIGYAFGWRAGRQWERAQAQLVAARDLEHLRTSATTNQRSP